MSDLLSRTARKGVRLRSGWLSWGRRAQTSTALASRTPRRTRNGSASGCWMVNDRSGNAEAGAGIPRRNHWFWMCESPRASENLPLCNSMRHTCPRSSPGISPAFSAAERPPGCRGWRRRSRRGQRRVHARIRAKRGSRDVAMTPRCSGIRVHGVFPGVSPAFSAAERPPGRRGWRRRSRRGERRVHARVRAKRALDGCRGDAALFRPRRGARRRAGRLVPRGA